MGSCLSWADKVLPIEFGGGYYRKEKVAEIQYAIVYVKATVSMKLINDFEYEKIKKRLMRDYGVVSNITT